MTRAGLFALAIGGLAGGPAFAASPNPKDLEVPAAETAKAEGLVRRLGSGVFREREAATAELARMGRLAKVALRAAGDDPDPEVRSRSQRLLSRAEADDLQVRLDAFLADAEGKFDHDLPGWAAYKAAAGADGPARELFAELAKDPQSAALLLAVEGPPADLPQAAAARRFQIWMNMNPGVFNRFNRGTPVAPRTPTAAEIAGLLVAEVALGGKPVPRNAGGMFVTTAQLLHTPVVGKTLRGTGPQAAAFRKLTGAWLDKLSDVNELQQVSYLIGQWGLKEGLPAMRRAAADPKAAAFVRAQALGVLAKVGGADELPTFRTLLADETVIQPTRFPPMKLELRDAALAMAAVATGQSPATFGLESQQPVNDNTKHNPWMYSFESPEKRAAGFKKWAEYDAKPAEKK